MTTSQSFGRTGHDSYRVIFGAAALGAMRQDRADRVLETVHASPINHLDTAASYGESELRLQPFLADHRDEYFLATKTGTRSGSGARRELELSLQRLGVDSVDLIQLHNLVEPDEWDEAFAPGGAVEALAAARDEGLARNIGVTGHGVRIADMHLRSLAAFDFASVLLPYNFTMMQNTAYRDSFEQLMTVCADRNVAVQTIKSVARGRWPEDSTEAHYSWYRALPAGEALGRAVAFALARTQVFVNTSSDARLLQPMLDAAASSAPAPTDAELEADIAEQNITPLFDGGDLERI